MATIPVQATGQRHVRKTVTLDGGANNGNLGDIVPLFTLTGRVMVMYATAYVSVALACTAPTVTYLYLLAGAGDLLTLAEGGGDFTGATGFLKGSAPGDVGEGGFVYAPAAANIGLLVYDFMGGADITAGTIIVDIWYLPITDDGALAGDDIDTELGAYLADKVLDEALSGHTTAGSLGKAVADVETDVDAVLVDTSTTLQAELDAIEAAVITNAAGVDIAADIIALKAETAAILADTAVIGAAGAGLTEAGGTGDHLTAVPWNAAWDAEVQSEAADALTAYDPPTKAELDSAVSPLALEATAQSILTDTDLIDDATSGLAKIATDVAAVLVDTSTTLQAELDGIQADTEDIQARLPAALVGGRIDATIDATGMESGAIDAILTRTMTEAYAAAGAEMTVAQALYEICQVFSEFAISGSTITVKQRDGSTTAMTFTLDSAIQPTSRTRAT